MAAMLTAEYVTNHVWRLFIRGGNTLSDRLVFLPDGSLQGCSDLAGCRWRLVEGRLFLITNDEVSVVCFDTVISSDRRHHLLSGKFALRDVTAPLCLVPLYSCKGKSTAELNSSISLNSRKDILLVTFNSLARPFDGYETRWEFYDLPNYLDLNCVRFSEPSTDLDPGIVSTWYLDKLERICAIVGGLVTQGYKACIFCGMSSGGYASLLVSEILSRSHPEVQFLSFTINPQTAHTFPHQEHLRSTMNASYWPAFLNLEEMEKRNIAVYDIDDVISRSNQQTSNIKHYIFYDSGNPVEVYYTGLLDKFSTCSLHPTILGLPHAKGCYKLFDMGVLQRTVELISSAVSAN